MRSSSNHLIINTISTSQQVSIWEHFEISFDLIANIWSLWKCRVEYAIGYLKKNWTQSHKVYKITEFESSESTRSFNKRQPMKLYASQIDMKPLKSIVLEEHIVYYTLNKSATLKRLSMRWTTQWELIVNQPTYFSDTMVANFLATKSSRILRHYGRFQTKKLHPNFWNHTRQHFVTHKTQAFDTTVSKVQQWSQIIPYVYNTIKVKQLKTKRWSCSSKKNLNFNYKILFLPESLQDYLVVHEMCHLKEMNHSHRFWSLVEEYYWPHYEARKQLKMV